MLFTSKGQELIMWKQTMMPDSELREVNGKKEFVKTGTKSEKTTYVFRGLAGDTIEIMGDNSHRAFEGELVDVEVDIVFSDFTRKNRVSLASVKKSTSK